jgi:hypothetical protein
MGTIRDLFVQIETFVLFLACVTVKNRLPVPLPLEHGLDGTFGHELSRPKRRRHPERGEALWLFPPAYRPRCPAPHAARYHGLWEHGVPWSVAVRPLCS